MPQVNYIRKNLDEAAILAAFAKVTFQRAFSLNDEEQAVMAALRRMSNDFSEASVEKIGEQLSSYSDEQIAGLCSNTKGILHEMEFVRLENEDGDSVYAAMFGDTNHPDVDVCCINADTNEVWDIQLKATDDASYAQSWIDSHPDGDIVVTEELAEALGIESSGMTNEDLTVRVDDVVDKLIDSSDDDTIWSYFPYITALSVALVVWELWQRHKRGQITFAQFKWMAAGATGVKVGKIAAISALMMVPGVNVVVGAALLARLIHVTRQAIYKKTNNVAH